MRVGVLGETSASVGGTTIDVGPVKQRAVLAALALHVGRPLRPEALAELVWADARPASPKASLQAYLTRIRQALGTGAPAGGGAAPAAIVTSAAGYRLVPGLVEIDAVEFAAAVAAVHRELTRAGTPHPAVPLPVELPVTRIERLLATLDTALGAWRGIAYADLAESSDVVAERARLQELSMVAQEDRAVLHLLVGMERTTVAELETLTAAHPLRERLWALRALALARAGRQGDALEVLRQVRELLVDELGVDPSPGLRALEAAILHQDQAVFAGTHAARGTGPEPDRARPAGAGSRPLVGRAAEIGALTILMDEAAAPEGRVGLLVGEAGAGKTRLVEELIEQATGRGLLTLVGRCSRDDGAPPLWPWVNVLDHLVARLGPDESAAQGGPTAVRDALAAPESGGPAGASRGAFTDGEAVRSVLAAAARERPILIVLEDLHWADSASLGVLRYLLEERPVPRTAILLTRRPEAEQVGALALVGEALARRHALRVELSGLSVDDGAALAEAATGQALDGDAARLLHARTGGNPFFVIELAKLPQAGRAVPAAVSEVIAARTALLPRRCQNLLRTAAVVGRTMEVDVLAAVTGESEDAVLDDLDVAVAFGLVTDDGGDRFSFSHALTRDALYERFPAARRSRRHAEIARVLSARSSGAPAVRLSETAYHWLEAGPPHAARAWRVAAEAGRYAVGKHAPEEAAQLFAAAVRAQDDDPAASTADRYELAMEQAEASRWAADREALDAALVRAIEHADTLDDVERLALAATGAVDGAVWHPRLVGRVHAGLLDALRRVLHRLPVTDSPLRCRAMLSRAVELYFSDAARERQALVDEGLAMARRIGDPELRIWACSAAFKAIWRPETAGIRLALADEVVSTARMAGDAAREAVGLTQRAIALQETGRIDDMRECATEARVLAQRLRLAHPLVVLGLLEVSWLALRGAFGEAEELLDSTSALMRRTSMPQQREGPMGGLLVLALSRGEVGPQVLDELALTTAGTALHLQSSLVLLLLRAGRPGEARAAYEKFGLPLDVHMNDFYGLMQAGLTAECAWRLGLRELAGQAYQTLAPFAGRPCSAGSSPAFGPVDRYLALAAAATGERELAGQHADDALALCEKWQIPVVTDWMTHERNSGGF